MFDIFFPDSYPNDPPHVLLRTTGGGTARFNPNLYDTGKVCLSLLGTWSGTHSCEKWSASKSSLLQVWFHGLLWPPLLAEREIT